MLKRIANAFHDAREHSRRRHAYRFLQSQSDAMLRDIGLSRNELYHAVMHGRDTR